MTRANTGSPELPLSLVPHYETLRRAALGEHLPPEARSGLAVLLRRGMQGWARAMLAASLAVPATQASSTAHTTASTATRAVIYVFAALAIANRRGAAQ
jgi:hypothetical protein